MIKAKPYGKTLHPIISFDCKSNSTIFAGPNALKAACYFIENGIEADQQELFDYKPVFKRAMYYTGNAVGDNVRGVDINGSGTHAKVYEFRNSIIFSSQNNVSSGLFEFAIVIEGTKTKPKLMAFVELVFKSAMAYSRYFK